jgi:hypothetical protein
MVENKEKVAKITPKNDISEKKKKKKKKKKKNNYKDMMADIMKPKVSQEEKLKLKRDAMMENALGGGSFKKIEVI